MIILMSTWIFLKNLVEKNFLIKKCFYSSAKDETTYDNGEKLVGRKSVEDCLTCKKIKNKCNMKNMGDYHDHYLKKDVLLLADIFEKIIGTCLNFYGFDRCYYFSSPGLSWGVMLKITVVKFKNISDIDMYFFIQRD